MGNNVQRTHRDESAHRARYECPFNLPKASPVVDDHRHGFGKRVPTGDCIPSHVKEQMADIRTIN